MPLIKSPKVPTHVSAFSMKDVELQARALIGRATQKAEQLIIEAQKQSEQLKKQAAEQGKKEGFAQGLAEGTQAGKKTGHDQALNEHRAKLTQLIQAMTAALTDFDKKRQILQTEATTDVVELALAIARRITKRQADIDPAVLTANISEAMKLVVHADDLRVAVHPNQRQVLMDELPNLQLTWPALAHAELVDDPTLSPGGCVVRSRQGIVDADLDHQLNRVMANLLPEKEQPNAE